MAKSLGGSDIDAAFSVRQLSDGGYIVAGNTLSNDFDVSGNHGNNDYWIVSLDNNGNINWQKTLGGSEDEFALCVRETLEKGYIIAGSTLSNNGDITVSKGREDYWIVKLEAPIKNAVALLKNSSGISNYPNPFTDKTTIPFSNTASAGTSLQVYNPLGQKVSEIIIPEGSINIILQRNGLPNGVYVYRIMKDEMQLQMGSFIVE